MRKDHTRCMRLHSLKRYHLQLAYSLPQLGTQLRKVHLHNEGKTLESVLFELRPALAELRKNAHDLKKYQMDFHHKHLDQIMALHNFLYSSLYTK